MGPIVLTVFAMSLVAVVKYLQALARRIDANLAAAERPVEPAGDGAAVVDYAKDRGRYSEWHVRRRSRLLVSEIEMFLAGQTS